MNKLFKTLLVATSVAPILLTYWFVNHVNSYENASSLSTYLIESWFLGWQFLVVTFALLLIFYLIIYLSKKKLQGLPIEIEEIKTADNESIAFILVYLLPLATGVTDSFKAPILMFVGVLFFFIVMTSNSYHFNPLINFIGYHFYEVKVKGGITYVLLSRKDITTSRTIKSVHRITEYMILEQT